METELKNGFHIPIYKDGTTLTLMANQKNGKWSKKDKKNLIDFVDLMISNGWSFGVIKQVD